MSFKVTDFGTNRKPICDFLLMINTNLHPILHRFEAIAGYCSNLVQKSLRFEPPWVYGQRTLFILGSLESMECTSYY